MAKFKSYFFEILRTEWLRKPLLLLLLLVACSSCERKVGSNQATNATFSYRVPTSTSEFISDTSNILGTMVQLYEFRWTSDTLHLDYILVIDSMVQQVKLMGRYRKACSIGEIEGYSKFLIGESLLDQKRRYQAEPYFLQSSKSFSRCSDTSVAHVLALERLGSYYSYKNSIDSALEMYHEAFLRANKLRMNLAAELLLPISRIYSENLMAPRQALEIIRSVQDYGEKYSDSTLLNDSWVEMGYLFSSVGQLDSAEKFANLSYDYVFAKFKRGNGEGKSTLATSIALQAFVFNKKNQFRESQLKCHEGLALIDNEPLEGDKSLLLRLLGESLYLEGKYEMALMRLEESIRTIPNDAQLGYKCKALLIKGKCFLSLGDSESAINVLADCGLIALEHSFLSEYMESFRLLSEASLMSGNLQNAEECRKRYAALKDSLIGQSELIEFTATDVATQFEKRLAMEAQEHQMMLAKEKDTKNRFILLAVLVGFLGLVSLVAMARYLLNQFKTERNVLEDENLKLKSLQEGYGSNLKEGLSAGRKIILHNHITKINSKGVGLTPTDENTIDLLMKYHHLKGQDFYDKLSLDKSTWNKRQKKVCELFKMPASNRDRLISELEQLFELDSESGSIN